MAGGLGTRMRSATPKHLHPLLGRRMVDWVLEAARPLGADPLVVVASPDGASGVRRASRSPSRTSRAGPATRSPPRATALDGVGGDLLVLSGDTPLLTPELLARPRSRRTAARAPPRRSSRSSRPTRASTAASSATTTGRSQAIVEAGDATPEQLAVGEVNSSIYVFDADRALARARPARRRTNAQGELYLTDAVRHLVENGERVAAHVAPDPAEAEGVNTRAELADAAAALRDRDQRGAHARRRHDRRPGDDVDRGRRRARARRDHPSVHRPARHDAGRARAPRSGRTRSSVDAVDRRRSDRRAVLLPSPRNGARGGREGRARSWRSRTRTSAKARRCRTSRTSATPRSARARTSAPATITANFPPQPGRPKGRTTIGRNVRTGVAQCVRCSGRRSATMLGLRRARSITEDVPPGPSRSPEPEQVNKEGYARRKRTTTELAQLPGLEAADVRRRRADARSTVIERGPQKRLMLFSGRSHPELAQKIGRAARRSSSARSSSRRSRTARRTAATSESIRGADVFIVQTGCRAGRPQPDGAADHDPGREARLGEADHGRHPVVPVLAPGPEGQAARADLRRASSPTCSSSPAPTAC